MAIQDFVSIYQPSIVQLHNKIAVLEVDGSILNGKNSSNFLLGGQTTGADDFDKLVKFVKNNRSYKGVILRVNSPVGSVGFRSYL